MSYVNEYINIIKCENFEDFCITAVYFIFLLKENRNQKDYMFFAAGFHTTQIFVGYRDTNPLLGMYTTQLCRIAITNTWGH